MNSYIIYKHISPSGKVYIGQTKQKPEARWRDGKGYKSCPAFKWAINKYGWENFEHKVLFSGLSKLDADLIEMDLIWYYKKLGISYNITDGGEGTSGHKKSENELKRMSERLKGKHLSPRTEFKKGHKNSKKAEEKRIEKISKPVQQFALDGTFIKEWPSAASVKEAGMDPTCITRASNGTYKQAYGYLWRKTR